jgi:hypothetical protein
MVFVAPGLGKAERDVYVALGMKALRNTEVGSGKTAGHMRRIRPSKH